MSYSLSHHTVPVSWIFPCFLHMLMCGLFLCWHNPDTSAQGINNNGAKINTQSSAVLNVQGSLINNNNGVLANGGTIIVQNKFVNNANAQGDGTFRVSGNWENNGLFAAGASSVVLEGGNQLITGTSQSNFNNLELLGTGIKTMTLDASSSGILALNNSELAADTNTFFVTNTSTSAITRTNGFVSSSLINGKSGMLSRQTAASGVYLFPVGSSFGIPRYRPTEITPASAAANTYAVIFYNNNATDDGWDISLKTTDIDIANPLFYTEIRRPIGTDPATISLFYDEIFDDAYIGMANWKGGQWNSISGVTMTPGGLNRITATNWVDFTTAPYIITKDFPIIPEPIDFFIYNTFTPDDNGQNDTWQIDNIEKFPNSEVKVFNRWGGLVFEASPYLNDWDGTIGGEKLPVTAYYYILKLGDGTEAHTGTVNITR